jgi:hypothetical protein
MTPQMKSIIRNFSIQLLIYSVLLVVYFALVENHLGEPLVALFEKSLAAYAVVSLVLILVQALFLDGIVSFIAKRLRLES